MLQIAVEEIAKACASSALILMIQELGSLPIQLFGTDEQKAALPAALRHRRVVAGLRAVRARGRLGPRRDADLRRPGRRRVGHQRRTRTGSPTPASPTSTSSSPRPTARTTAARRSSSRPTATGFDPGKLEHKLGIKGSPTGSPSFDDVRVPAENLIGAEGKGLSVALGTLERTRLGAAAQAVGIAQGATDYANEYAKERIAFGKPINAAAGHPVQARRHGDRHRRRARAALQGLRDGRPQRRRDLGKYTSMAKLFASDNAMKVTIEAIQVLGGYGYVNEYPVERMMRDAKITQIYEGTNEIQRVVIARSMK